MSETNPNSRLEAFSDGVFAIALTLLIIEIKIPDIENTHNNSDLWLALRHILPSVFAFLLSFFIILICWVNHHAMLKLVDNTSYPFIYGNGVLLLFTVILPFPTHLLGEYLLTPSAVPAVVLYTAANATSTFGWILSSHTAIKGQLTKNQHSLTLMKDIRRNGIVAFFIYSTLAVMAFWFPLTITILLTIIWIIWLIYGIRLKNEE